MFYCFSIYWYSDLFKLSSNYDKLTSSLLPLFIYASAF